MLATTAVAAAPETVVLPDGRTFLHDVLDNGLEVSVVSDPGLEIVATQVWYHVGSADEDAGSRGLAHLFEHLMFGPTARHAKDAVFTLHDRHGGDNNAYTSFDETVYLSEIAPPQHLEVLALEASRMRELRLSSEELANEQRIVTEELRLAIENDPFTRLFVAALGALLGDHPYALTPAGTKADIDAATLEACRRFYDTHYRPPNAHVVVAGPVEPRRTLDAVRERFGAIEPGDPAPRREIPAVVEHDFPPETVLEEDLPPVETAIVFFPLPAADHPDGEALELLTAMLAGAANPFREELVRRRGKALEAGIERLEARRGGAFAFFAAQLPYRRKATAFRLVDRAIGAMEAVLTADRLDAARRALIRDAARERYSAEAQARAVGAARWLEGDPRRAFDRERRLRAVSIDDVRRVWRTWIEEAEPARLYVRPERVPLLVRLFGWAAPLVLR